jgi:enamine deaminase RidA (YjgF/YER057c/UK114 family)
MQKTIYSWLGKEFVFLCGEARPLPSVAEQTEDLFRRFEAELKRSDLSLENIARVRIWARDREARNLATMARAKILTGRNRAASSSYISVGHFDSESRVALDLLAMRPEQTSPSREAVDFVPPRNYLSHLCYESMVFVSGFTSQAGNIAEQVPAVVADLNNAFKAAPTSWTRVVRLSIFLGKTQDLEAVKSLLANTSQVDAGRAEFSFVDGFASEQSLLEIESTALIGS